jgi:hypothetical protein
MSIDGTCPLRGVYSANRYQMLLAQCLGIFGWCGAAGAAVGEREAPAMGRGTGLGKRRGQGDDAGAENREIWRGMVSVCAADGGVGATHCGECT